MQSENRFFDDFARMAEGAFNALSGARTEVEALMRQQIEHFAATMKLVTREELETVEALAAKAREAEEALAERVAVLEAELAELKAAARPRGRAKAAPRDEAPDEAPSEE